MRQDFNDTKLKKISFFFKKDLTDSKHLFKYGTLIAKTIRPPGVVAQFWLEHRPVTPEVASSSLVYPANKPSLKERVFRFSVIRLSQAISDQSRYRKDAFNSLRKMFILKNEKEFL